MVQLDQASGSQNADELLQSLKQNEDSTIPLPAAKVKGTFKYLCGCKFQKHARMLPIFIILYLTFFGI